MKLRTYEALYVVRPDKGDEEVQTIANGIEAQVTAQGGAIVRSEIWGKRKLAYEVKNFTEGHYVLVRFQAVPSFVSSLDASIKLSDDIIRHLIVYFDEKTLRLEEEQQIRKEAEIQASAQKAARGERDSDDDDDEDDRPRGRRSSDDDDD